MNRRSQPRHGIDIIGVFRMLRQGGEGTPGIQEINGWMITLEHVRQRA